MLAPDPVFLFAGEPTSRLDLITRQETIDLLTELARELRGPAGQPRRGIMKTGDRQDRIGITGCEAAG